MKQFVMQIIAGCLATMYLGSCGALNPSDEEEDLEKLAAQEQAEAQASAEPLVYEFTAEYTPNNPDIVLLRENSDRIAAANAPFASRLWRDDNPDVEQAFQEMAVRLYFLKADWRLAMLDTMFASLDEVNTRAGVAVADGDGQNILLPTTASFIDTFMDYADFTSPRNNSAARNNGAFNLPLQAIRGMLDSHPGAGVMRDGTLLTIVYVGFLPEKDTIDVADIIAELDASRGEGNWVVHVLAPDEAGCDYALNDDTPRHSNMDAAAAGSTDPAVYAAYRRPNKMLKLQQHSGGMFQSICAESYVDFMKKVVDEGTQNAFFPVALSAPPDQTTLAIYVNGAPVETWRYNKTDNTLYLPTTIPVGANFIVSYKPDLSKEDEFTSSESTAQEQINPISGAQLSQQEIDFYGGIRDVFQSNGCIGCHGAYGQFDAAWDDREMILNRINRDVADPQYMPQGGAPFDTPENRDALVSWLTSG